MRDPEASINKREILSDDPLIKGVLDLLADKQTSASSYQDAMTQAGSLLAEQLLSNYDLAKERMVCIVSTVEDADFLSAGMHKRLHDEGVRLSFVCMWNERDTYGGGSVAPIMRRFEQTGFEESSCVIVVKSIISSACVVKTNLTAMFEKISPQSIYIAAPVIYKDAEVSLCGEFPSNFSSRFNFTYFAKDDVRTEDGEIVPGVGGNVYKRLGFSGQSGKNAYFPKIVSKFLFANAATSPG